jgi:hypothetical protein
VRPGTVEVERASGPECVDTSGQERFLVDAVIIRRVGGQTLGLLAEPSGPHGIGSGVTDPVHERRGVGLMLLPTPSAQLPRRRSRPAVIGCDGPTSWRWLGIVGEIANRSH